MGGAGRGRARCKLPVHSHAPILPHTGPVSHTQTDVGSLNGTSLNGIAIGREYRKVSRSADQPLGIRWPAAQTQLCALEGGKEGCGLCGKEWVVLVSLAGLLHPVSYEQTLA